MALVPKILRPSPGLLFSGRAQATLHREHLVARGAYRGSVMGEPPIGRDVVFLRVNRIADDKIVERWRPERSSNAPDRRLADLELSRADRAALAQCAEFGQ